MQGKRHLTIGHGLLRKVIVNYEHMTAGMGGVSGISMRVIVHEVFANRRACHRRNVLKRSRVSRSGSDYDRLIKDPMLCKVLLNHGNCGGLLPYGDIDADHIRVTLVNYCINGYRRLAGLPVADDELSLPTAYRNHGIDSQQACLHRLTHGLAFHDSRSLEFDRTAMGCVDRTLTVNGLA